ncbi:MAG: hypothetical protein CMJ31_04980, partial [Phycisphaerae bacterium]|nr:hypothetical protein [Phycisphaerae bacterium]
TSVGPWIVTQNFGTRQASEPQLVGVVIDDADGDGVYDAGEGLSGVRVTAIAADGGAIALINCESRILGVAFDDNTAAGDGGAIYRAAGLFSEHPSMVIGSCQFTGGAAERGSDLFVSDSAAPAVFVNNVVRAGGTAVTPIWADGSGRAAGFLTLANNTIVNDPAAPGFALVLESNGSRVFNNILVGFGPNPVAGTPLSDIRFNLFDGLTPGDQRFDATNIVGDPMFVDAEAGDYHLSSASPAIDAGSNELIPRDHLDGDGDLNTFETLPVDRRLALRIIAANGGGTATVDLGAIEFDPAADPTSCVADFTGDNRLDIADVVLFLQAFGAGCP